MIKFNSKIIIINFIILIALIFAPGIIWKFNWLFVRSTKSAGDKRAELKVTKDTSVTAKVLKEYKNLPYTYRSFLGWRRDNITWQYTKISGRYNTRISKGESLNNSTWFFGGSTIWGVGVTNNQTIPSHFHSISGENVMNFGESGWTTRQDLNLLMNLLGDNNKPKRIIFYSGLNDIQQCRTEINKIPSNSKEKRIGKKLRTTPEKLFVEKSLNFLVRPYTDLNKKLRGNVNLVTDQMYDCDSNPKKAFSIANHLIKNLEIAYDLSKKYDSEFIAIIHPTAFSYEGEVSYLPDLHPELRKQINVINPLLFKLIEKECDKKSDFCKTIYDGSNWVSKNVKDKVYFDNVHLNSVGNKFIAKEIFAILN